MIVMRMPVRAMEWRPPCCARRRISVARLLSEPSRRAIAIGLPAAVHSRARSERPRRPNDLVGAALSALYRWTAGRRRCAGL
jgi:hypothetical protein